MNSADLVAKYRFAPDRPLTMPTEGKSIQVAWDDFLVLADCIEALEAWKAETMEALRPFAAYKTADGIDDDDFLRIPDDHPVLFNGMGDDYRVVVNIGHFRAARNFVEKEDGRAN